MAVMRMTVVTMVVVVMMTAIMMMIMMMMMTTRPMTTMTPTPPLSFPRARQRSDAHLAFFMPGDALLTPLVP